MELESEEGVKRCSRCRQHKPRAAFARNKAMRDLQAYCRERWAAYHQARQLAKGKNIRPRVETPEGHKFCRGRAEAKPHSADHLKRNYGLTEAEGDAMIASRYGLCAICLAAPPAHVDHCHKTGRVRGVPCFNCDSAIGKLRDDHVGRRAVAYLEGNLWKPILVAPGVYQLPS